MRTGFASTGSQGVRRLLGLVLLASMSLAASTCDGAPGASGRIQFDYLSIVPPAGWHRTFSDGGAGADTGTADGCSFFIGPARKSAGSAMSDLEFVRYRSVGAETVRKEPRMLQVDGWTGVAVRYVNPYVSARFVEIVSITKGDVTQAVFATYHAAFCAGALEASLKSAQAERSRRRVDEFGIEHRLDPPRPNPAIASDAGTPKGGEEHGNVCRGTRNVCMTGGTFASCTMQPFACPNSGILGSFCSCGANAGSVER